MTLLLPRRSFLAGLASLITAPAAPGTRPLRPNLSNIWKHCHIGKHRGRGKKGKASETDGFSATRFRNARAIAAYSRELAFAMLWPEPEKGGRGKKGKASETDGFSSTRFKQARAIIAHSRELALAVR